MKTKTIIGISIIISFMSACGPSDEEKRQRAYEEQKAQKKKVEDDYMNNMASIRSNQEAIIRSMTLIKDTTIRHCDGRIYVPSGEIWELKRIIMDMQDSIPSPIDCECPDYQKNMESATSPHDAIINGRCIKFSGTFIANQDGNSSYSYRTFDIIKPKHIPSEADITLFEHRILVIKRYRITDLAKFDETRRLIEYTKSNPNNQILQEYYYTHSFNPLFDTGPLKFGTCTELTD